MTSEPARKGPRGGEGATKRRGGETARPGGFSSRHGATAAQRAAAAAHPAGRGRRSGMRHPAEHVSHPPRRPSAPPRQAASTPQSLLATYRPDLAQVLAEADAPPFRHAQVLEHLFRAPIRPFAHASVLPGDLRARLDEFGPSVLSVAATRTAADGTSKLLLEARDGSQVEAVVLPYGSRATACISSQVGCAVGCAFCATGALGFRRNLSAAEIVDQLRAAAGVAAEVGWRISNVVYMGMGEPLLNLGAVLDSIRVITSPHGLGMGHRSLSVSTVGIPNGILRLGRAEPQVNLALSLHAVDDAGRALLIPEGFRRPLADVLDAAWEHFAITSRKLLVEYVLLQGVNDSVDDARKLAALLRGHVVAVNLLAWNPVCPEEAEATEPGRGPRRRRTFRPSSPAAVAAFRAALRAANIEAVVRQSKGAGIEAACGQLAGARGSYQEDQTGV